MRYWLCMTGDEKTPGIDGAIMPREPVRQLVNTIEVTSIDDTVKMVEASGGKIIASKMAVPGVGWMIYFTDTEGNLSGAMQMDENAK